MTLQLLPDEHPIYVDEIVIHANAPRPLRRGCCHMWCADQAKLDRFAKKLGLKLEWKHEDHFDISVKYRAKAVVMGAIEVTGRDLVKIKHPEGFP